MTEIVFRAGIELPYLHRNIALSTKIARGLIKDICTKLSARAVTFACLMLAAMPFAGVSATEAFAETRSLKLYYIHTREKAVITFKRNGKYDQKGLQELNRFCVTGVVTSRRGWIRVFRSCLGSLPPQWRDRLHQRCVGLPFA